MSCVQGGKTLLVPTPRQRTGILSQIQLPDECDEDILSKYSTRQVVNDVVLSGLFPVNLESPGINLVRKPTKITTCSSDGSGNNAKHSWEKSGNFIVEIEWEPWFCQ